MPIQLIPAGKILDTMKTHLLEQVKQKTKKMKADIRRRKEEELRRVDEKKTKLKDKLPAANQ